MLANISTKHILAVVIAGIVGTLLNAFAASIVISPDKIGFALVPGRYAVAIAVAALLPFVYAACKGKISWPLAMALLTVIPSLIAKLVFGAGAPWTLVLSLNAVYALGATIAYALVTGQLSQAKA